VFFARCEHSVATLTPATSHLESFLRKANSVAASAIYLQHALFP
jgi:hypothetical protein